MKHFFSILSIFLLSFHLVNAQSLVKPEKLPDSALNFVVASDMGRKGVSEQKNVFQSVALTANASRYFAQLSACFAKPRRNRESLAWHF